MPFRPPVVCGASGGAVHIVVPAHLNAGPAAATDPQFHAKATGEDVCRAFVASGWECGAFASVSRPAEGRALGHGDRSVSLWTCEAGVYAAVITSGRGCVTHTWDLLKVWVACYGRVQRHRAQVHPHHRFRHFPRELVQEREKVQAALDSLECLHQEQVATGYDAEARQQAEERLRECQKELEGANSDPRTTKEEAQEWERKASSHERALAIGAAARDRLRAAAAASDRREERLLELLTAFCNRFFTRNTAAIARRANEIIAQAVASDSIGSILGAEIGHGGELTYRDASHARQLVGRLSGGGKATVTIAPGSLLMLVNPCHGPRRRRLSIAHEFDHLILGHRPVMIDRYDGPLTHGRDSDTDEYAAHAYATGIAAPVPTTRPDPGGGCVGRRDCRAPRDQR